MITDIIIPVHNRWDHTKQTLESLFLNTNPDDYYLYVIDDMSDPEVSKNLQDFLLPMQRSVNHELGVNFENIGPGASRNLVAKTITDENRRGDFLYHSDNDVYFTHNWLPKLIEAFIRINALNEDKVKLLGGGCHPYLQNNYTFPLNENVHVGIKDAVSGYSQLMRWETWDKYGPFDETMRGQEQKIMGSEDWAFCQKIIKDGFLVGAVDPELVIHTGKTNTYGNFATGHEIFKDIDGVMVR